MRKANIRNLRYPHTIKIVRVLVGKADENNPFADDDAKVGEDTEIVIYEGEGRSYTDTTTEGGTITVLAANYGVRDSESVSITGGDLAVTAGNDGIKSTVADKAEKGFVEISGGSIAVAVVLFVNLMNFIISPIAELPGLLACRKAALGLVDKLAAALERSSSREGSETLNRLENVIGFACVIPVD